MAGDCYVVAFHEAWDHGGVLVHGWPTGRGGNVAGERYGHAWVERDDIVIDRSNGLDVEMPRVFYYKLGQIREEECKRYTPEEAARKMLRTEHYGPWAERAVA